MLHCLQMLALDKELCCQRKERGMLGVHCRITPHLALGLLTLATFQLTFCRKSVCCLQRDPVVWCSSKRTETL